MTHDTDAERQAFEAWCDKNEYDRVERLDGSGYNNEKTKRAWLAWQAARRAQVAPSSENATVNVWQQAVDYELVSAHLGVAGDVTYEEAAKALHDLICWNIEVATGPLTNGGNVLVPADAIAANKPAAPVPQGYKLVPVKPPQEALEAINLLVDDHRAFDDSESFWHYLLAAAPQPPEAAPVEFPEPVAYRLRNTAFRSEVYEYFRTKYLAECRQKQFNASVDDGGLHELTPIYTEQQVRELLAAAKDERKPLSADEIKEPKNCDNWRVEWWNESCRMMLPADKVLDSFQSYKNGTMQFTLKQRAHGIRKEKA